jgi:tetratricopeptide (TPR) repeat protein
MLDKKDVDLPYLDRKINYLKIFALLEPENHRFPLEIGATLLEKGLSLGALNHTTVLLYRAEKYLAAAVAMKPDDVQAKFQLAEISYLLGRYDVAQSLWAETCSELPAEVTATTAERLRLIKSGQLPFAPAVDYLQAIGVAMESFAQADYEEAAAIILDAMEALAFFEEFPLAEINHVLGLCYLRMDIPLYAEQYFRQALQLKPDYDEARRELKQLLGEV